MKKLIGVALALAAVNATAGVVYNAKHAESQVTLNRNETGITACGIRVIAIAEIGDQTRWYDFSGSIYRDGLFGLWKAGSYSHPTADLLKNVPSPKTTLRLPAPVGFWLSEAGNNIPVSMEKTAPAEDKGFVIGGADFSRTATSIMAVANGDVTQFVVKYKNERSETIISFKAPLKDTDHSTFVECLRGLQGGIKADDSAEQT